MLRFFQFINSCTTSSASAGHGEDESISGIVIHHLGDNMLNFYPIRMLNEKLFNEKLFGIFDMKITFMVLMMWVVSLIIILIFIPVAMSLKRQGVSSSKWVNLWEALISFVHDDIVSPNFDHHYVNKAMPYFCSLFFFILFSNLTGLIPGLKTSTGNLAVTAGLAICTLLGILGVGIIKQGPIGYFKGLVPHGVPVFLMPIMLPIEIVSLFIKPFSLTIRLFANMTGGHVVVIIFLYLVVMFQSVWVGFGSVVGALMIYFLELLVAFIQAYIFTSLSAMFISSSMHAH